MGSTILKLVQDFAAIHSIKKSVEPEGNIENNNGKPWRNNVQCGFWHG
jgi:hypothetical protein